ncbi:signal recognition particle 14kD protein [Xylariaceae sp. FL1019]|nr:signal recognition particle 14kD protein [Xylariaceae sp. FL1019]
MGVLTNDEFFARLVQLFDARKGKDHGQVVLVQKRLTYDQNTTDAPKHASSSSLADLQPAKPLPILIRATNAKGKADRKDKIKLSTVVEPGSLSSFFDRYAEICKVGMASLKPRDRSRRKGKAKKKKTAVA